MLQIIMSQVNNPILIIEIIHFQVFKFIPSVESTN